MPKFFVSSEQITQNSIIILGQDVNHIKKVLRAKIGDKLEICNKETFDNYICQINQIEENKIDCEIKEKTKNTKESNIKVTIFQGLPKADKMELVIQKSVELGVHNITPISMKRCVMKLNDKDKIKKTERWQKIAEVAAKQCGRDYIPKINQVIALKEISTEINEYDTMIVAYEKEEFYSLKEALKEVKKQKESQEKESSKNELRKKEEIKIGVVIGPEGGLDGEEIEILKNKGAKVVTLGKRILRTETVALNILSIIMYELED